MSNTNQNEINKASWDAYQEDYMKFELKSHPDYFEFFANGGVELDDFLLKLIGDVKGLKLLDTCCACDAVQALSWHNLGARVTACDITPTAIKIAKNNAKKMKLDLEFVVADMQTLEPVSDNQFDIVFASYPVWIQDLNQACKTWHRVLKQGGKLLLAAEHPITNCITEDKNGIQIVTDYNQPSKEVFSSFDGTPKARKFGGWSVALPSVQNFYRVSDIMNAILAADFKIKTVYESPIVNEESQMKNLPCDLVVLAMK